MAKHRKYTLPGGRKTTQENRYKKQWTEFLKPLAKELKLSIGKFDSEEAELLLMFTKGNKKSVPEARVTLPHWLIWRILQVNNKNNKIINHLIKGNEMLREENAAYQQYCELMQRKERKAAQELVQENAGKGEVVDFTLEELAGNQN